MSIVLNSSGGGSVTVNEPTTASNFTQTLPASDGTVMVSGNMPAFRAHATNNQSISSATFTKISFPVEDFDTANCFDSTTNHRFTPTVAGYYQVNATVLYSGTMTRALFSIHKNGSQYTRPADFSVATTNIYFSGSDLIYMNGTTDYLEIYAYATGSGLFVFAPATNEWSTFSASLVRTA